VTDNACNSNDIGIKIQESSYNTISTNICNANRIGIYLSYGCLASNIIADNTFLGNTERDILEELPPQDEEFDPGFLLPIGLAGIIMLGAAWRMFSGIREFTET
jgi:parallel beta-helix repeat protein